MTTNTELARNLDNGKIRSTNIGDPIQYYERTNHIPLTSRNLNMSIYQFLII